MYHVRVTNPVLVIGHSHPISTCRSMIKGHSTNVQDLRVVLGESKYLLTTGSIMGQGLAHAAPLGLCCVLDASALLTLGTLSADISRHWQAQPWHWQRLCAVEAPWGSSLVIQMEGTGGLATDIGRKVLQRCTRSKWQTPCYYADTHLWGPVRHVPAFLRGNRGKTEVNAVKHLRSRGRELHYGWY